MTFLERQELTFFKSIKASAAISDDTVWRPLNYRILLKLRHDQPEGMFK